MPKQYFKTIREYADRMSFGADNKPMHKPVYSLEVQSKDVSAISFDQQLAKGLYTPISQLVKNKVGWCYRSIPVVIYKHPEQQNKIHISSDCPILNNDNSWVWVSSSNQICGSSKYQLCEFCIEALKHSGLQTNNVQAQEESFDFIGFIKRNSHYYFHEGNIHQSGINLWKAGEPISKSKSIYAAEGLHKLACTTCTWELPDNAPYWVFSKEYSEEDEIQPYCMLCAQAHTQQVLILPENLRWNALQERYHYFQGVSENWAHLRLHLDVTWYPLIDALKRRGVELPRPYYPIYYGQRITLLTTLAWPDKNRAVIADEEWEDLGEEGRYENWNIIRYSDLLNSLSHG